MGHISRPTLLLSLSLLLLSPQLVSAKLLINEVYPNPDGDEKTAEWIELYNDGDMELNLNGYLIADKARISNPYVLPSITLLPHSFYVAVAADTNIQLNNSTDSVKLFDPLKQLIDEFSYNSTTPNQSYCRLPDGGEWHACSKATKGSANTPASPSIEKQASKEQSDYNTEDILLSEIMSCPSELESEWLEFENTAAQAANLANWKLIDAAGNSQQFSLMLPANGVAFITLNKAILNNAGDSIKLVTDKDVEFASVTFGSCQIGSSFIRQADWSMTTTPTKGSKNILTLPTSTPAKPKTKPSTSPKTQHEESAIESGQIQNSKLDRAATRSSSITTNKSKAVASVAGILSASAAGDLNKVAVGTASSTYHLPKASHSLSYFLLGGGGLVSGGVWLYARHKRIA